MCIFSSARKEELNRKLRLIGSITGKLVCVSHIFQCALWHFQMEETNYWYSQQKNESKDMHLVLKNGAKPCFPKGRDFCTLFSSAQNKLQLLNKIWTGHFNSCRVELPWWVQEYVTCKWFQKCTILPSNGTILLFFVIVILKGTPKIPWLIMYLASVTNISMWIN